MRGLLKWEIRLIELEASAYRQIAASLGMEDQSVAEVVERVQQLDAVFTKHLEQHRKD